MSAQSQEAAGQLPNGTSGPACERADDPVEPCNQGDAGPISEGPRQSPDVRPGEVIQTGVQDSAGAAGSAETASMLVQAGLQQEALTIPDMGGRSAAEQSASVQKPIDIAEGYSTPRSSMGQRGTVHPSWLAGVEIPKWMSRLGSMLQPGSSTGQGELASSPFPSPAFASPPGGQPFRLRSPGKARAISSAPTPPSSSSIPAEAIQAEVQRQLHGVLSQLKDYAERNNELQAELEQTKALLRDERRKFTSTEHTMVQPTPLLGDLAGAHMGPGLLPNAPVPLRDPEPLYQGQQGVLSGQGPPGLPDVEAQRGTKEQGTAKEGLLGFSQMMLDLRDQR